MTLLLALIPLVLWYLAGLDGLEALGPWFPLDPESDRDR